MPNPAPYVFSYSFQGWQALNPFRPLPALQVDNEFGKIENAFGSLSAALSDIRRSDGQLRNYSVTLDAMDPALVLSLLNSGSNPGAVQAGVDALLSMTTGKYVQRPAALSILGDGTDETGKLADFSGPFAMDGKRITVSALSAVPKGLDPVGKGAWRVTNVEGDRPGCYPVNDTLPVTRTPLDFGSAYNVFTEDKAMTFQNERFVFQLSTQGGHGDAEPSQIKCFRTIGQNTWATCEYLWGPDAASPLGYRSASAGMLGAMQFILVSAFVTPRAFKLYRRRLQERVELRGVMSTRADGRYGFRRVDYNISAFVGMKLNFQEPPANFSGVTFFTSDYTVTDADDEWVYIDNIANPQVATADQYGAGGNVTIIVRETPFEEVKFGNDLVSWGQHLLSITGNPTQPNYPTGFGGDGKYVAGTTRAGRAYIGCSSSGFPTAVRMKNLWGGGTKPAFIDLVKNLDTAYEGASQPSFKVVDDGTAAGKVVSFMSCRAPGGGVSFVSSSDGMATATVTNYTQQMSLNCGVYCVVYPDCGDGIYIIGSTASSRSPGGRPSSNRFIDHWLLIAKLSDALATGVTAFEWWRYASVSSYDHSGVGGEPDGPAPIGVGSIGLLPGGGGVWTVSGESTPILTSGSVNQAGQVVSKIGTNFFTKDTRTPNLSPDVVMFYDRLTIQFAGTTTDTTVNVDPTPVSASYLNMLRRQLDSTLGDYIGGVFTPRTPGYYEFDVTALVKTDGTLCNVVLWSVDTGAPLLEPYGNNPFAQSLIYAQQTGGVLTSNGRARAKLRQGQRVAAAVRSGTVIASDTVNRIKIERVG